MHTSPRSILLFVGPPCVACIQGRGKKKALRNVLTLEAPSGVLAEGIDEEQT